ncbi:MAG: hypothetical protein QOD64_2191 [Verrucomicrobiota bacterium]|jgi:hypothetical protein
MTTLNSNMTGTAAGLPDRAIGLPGEDFLNRASFANALADQILNAPSGQTLRIGVYGGWGEGKTSVLALMHQRLHEKDQICLWIAPWAAQTRDEVLGELIKQLSKKLEIDASSLGKAQTVATVASSARAAAEEATWWSKGGATLFGSAVQKYFDTKAAAEVDRFFDTVAEKLAGRRIIVFIDDLDRVRSEFIAELLLTLREALDQPNFFYVMALAPEIVQRGLQAHHGGWGNAAEFLEKIVEFPRYLPAPTDRDIEIFLQKSTAILAGAIDADVLRAISPLLPRNPRKLKLYLRLMASLRGLVARFDPAEIDLTMLYTVQLLRSEFPEETRQLIDDPAVIKDLEHGAMFDRMDRDKKEHSRLNPSSQHLPDAATPRIKSRFDVLYNGIRNRGTWDRGRYGLHALFTLPDEPPLITWKELNAFIEEFRTGKSDERTALLRGFVSIEDTVDARRAEAAFSLVIEMRQTVFSQAADAHIDEDRKKLLVEAEDLTEILSRFVTDLKAFATPLFSVTGWKVLLGHVQKWAHFTKLPEYEALRAEERNLLSSAAESMTDELGIAALDTLGWEFDFQGNEGPTFTTYLKELRAELQRVAAEHILESFKTPDGLESFWGDRGSQAMKNILFRPDSLLFENEKLRARFMKIASASSNDAVVQRNFIQYTRMLLYGATEGASFGRDECRAFFKNGDIMSAVWHAAVARPLNPRIAGGFRERRNRLIANAVISQEEADDVMPLPTWWHELEESFFKTP